MDSSPSTSIRRRVSVSESTSTVNLKTVKKILEVLAKDGRIKRTQLSVKAGMNYDRCMRYINILKLIKLVEIVLENNCNYVIITQTGIEIINLLDYI